MGYWIASKGGWLRWSTAIEKEWRSTAIEMEWTTASSPSRPCLTNVFDVILCFSTVQGGTNVKLTLAECVNGLSKKNLKSSAKA
jgi:hypothetical protein